MVAPRARAIARFACSFGYCQRECNTFFRHRSELKRAKHRAEADALGTKFDSAKCGKWMHAYGFAFWPRPTCRCDSGRAHSGWQTSAQ
jgi:hypothetical protein